MRDSHVGLAKFVRTAVAVMLCFALVGTSVPALVSADVGSDTDGTGLAEATPTEQALQNEDDDIDEPDVVDDGNSDENEPVNTEDDGTEPDDTGDETGNPEEGDTGDDGTVDDGTEDDGTVDDGDSEEGTPGEGETGDGTPGEGETGDGTPEDGDTEEGAPGEGETGDGTPEDGDTEEGAPGEGETGDGTPEDGDIEASTPEADDTDGATSDEKSAKSAPRQRTRKRARPSECSLSQATTLSNSCPSVSMRPALRLTARSPSMFILGRDHL